MESKTIHTITVIHSKEYFQGKPAATRTWGYYFNFQDAEDVVIENQTDIFEYLYDLAVIEERGEGPLDVATNRKWYKATYPGKGQPPIVKKIREPKKFKNIVNFGMG